jgi:hypothetical protein
VFDSAAVLLWLVGLRRRRRSCRKHAAPGANADSDADPHTDTDADANADTNTHPDTNADANAHADTDGDQGEG